MTSPASDPDDDQAEADAMLAVLGYERLAALDPAATRAGLRAARTMAQRVADLGDANAEPAIVFHPVSKDGGGYHD